MLSRSLIILITLGSLLYPQQWQYKSVVVNGYSVSTDNGAADVNLAGFRQPYAVGVDPNGCVWTGTYYDRRLENTDGLSDPERYPDLWYEIDGDDTTEIWNKPLWIWNPGDGAIDTVRFMNFGGAQDTLVEGFRGIERTYDGNMIVMIKSAVYKINYQSYEVIAKWDAPEEIQPLQGLSVDANGYVYVLGLFGGEMYILDPDDLSLYYSFTAGDVLSRGHAVTPDGKDIYIGDFSDSRGVLHYHGAYGPDGTYTFVDTVGKEVVANGTVMLDPNGYLWIIGAEAQDEKMWAFDPQDNYNIVDSTSFKFAGAGDTTIYGYPAPEYVRCIRESAFSLDGKKMYLADFYSYSIKEFQRQGGIKVTFRANTCGVPDILQEYSTVQVRGNLTELGGWTTASPVYLNNIGGDYWEGSVYIDSATAADQIIEYKYCTYPAKREWLPEDWQGWEGGNENWTLDLSNFTGTDTTLELAYVRGWTYDPPGVIPFNPTDSIDIYFRVNMQAAQAAGIFDSTTDQIGVRGSNTIDWGTTGDLSWNDTYFLTKESDHVNGPYSGSDYEGTNFWSGRVRIPVEYAGTSIEYKFVYHDNSNGEQVEWETTSNRFSHLPAEGDTTLHWVWWNDTPPGNRTKFYVSNGGDDSNGDGSYANPFATIQHAINQADNNDSVVVMDGTYFENLIIENKTITLGSLYLDDNDDNHRSYTELNGNQSGSVLEIRNTNDELVNIEGLWLTNGLAYTGGGVNASAGRLRIFNCSLTDNTADTLGGGLSAIHCPEVNIESCYIESNTSWGASGGLNLQECNAYLYGNYIGNNQAPDGWCGGVQFHNPDQGASYNLIMESCHIDGNSAATNGGIDIWTNDDGSAVEAYLSNCTISSNQSGGRTGLNSWGANTFIRLANVEVSGNWSDKSSAGLHIDGNSYLIADHCLIWNNHTDGSTTQSVGTGVVIWCSARADLLNCTIIANDGGTGAGLTNSGGNEVNVINTIIWNNSPSEVYLDQYDSVWGVSTFSYSAFGDPGQIVSSNLSQYYNDGGGNITDDPQLVNDLYELSATSPCIDTGHPDLDNDGTSWENDPDDQDPDGTRMDMGAFYFHHEVQGYDTPVWQTYYADSTDFGFAVAACQDGGFLQAGMSDGNIDGNGYDGLVVKYSSDGVVEWSKFYGSTGSDYIYKISQTENGDFLLAGFTDSWGSGNFDAWVIRIDNSGNEIWSQVFGGEHDDRCYGIFEAASGEIIMAGLIGSYGNGEDDYWLASINPDGSFNWEQTYGGALNDFLFSAVHTSDNGYLLIGHSDSWYTNGDKDVYLVKTDSSGIEQWSDTYGSNGDEIYCKGTETSDGSFVITSRIYVDDHNDVWALKIDANGYEIWNNYFGGSGNDYGYGIIEDLDQHYVLGGYSNSRDINVMDAWLCKIDPDGNLVWNRFYGYENGARGRDLCQAHNGDYVLGGFTTSFGDGSVDFYLLRAPGDLSSSDIFYVATDGSDQTGDGSYGSPFATIQHAIDLADHDYEVEVQPGTYYENLDFLGKTIHVSSAYSDATDHNTIEQTIIDGGGSGSVVLMNKGEQWASLHGLTIQNGSSNYGGGILVETSWVELNDVIVKDNNANNNGGGIYVNGDSVRIKNVVLYGNSAEYGAGLYSHNSDYKMVNCSIINNQAVSNGWGIYTLGSTGDITNSLIWNPSGYDEIYLDATSVSNLTIEYSDIDGGGSRIVINSSQLNLLDGILDVEPQIIDGSYCLSYSSPCIDAGHPDLDGDGTSWENDPDDQDPDGSRPDIGAGYYADEIIDFVGFTKDGITIIATEGGNSNGMTWVDYNSDGFDDLFVANDGAPCYLYVNNGQGGFDKVTGNAIVSDTYESLSASWADMNNDGFPELAVGNGLSELQDNCYYENINGTDFEKVPLFDFVDGGRSFGISWADYDNDGYVDLFVANHAGVNNQLYHNENGDSLQLVTTGPIVNDGGSSFHGAWADYDNDRDLDLFVSNRGGENNFLYRNNGDGTFDQVTSSVVVQDGGISNGASWGDLDNDGDLDLFVANKGQPNFLYQNDGQGNFSRLENNPIVELSRKTFGSTWGDLDNDGDLDLYVTNVDEDNELFINLGDSQFERVKDQVIVTDGGASGGTAWSDFDNDGDLDLFTVNWNNENNFFYINDGNENNWLECKLLGVSSNYDAIGAQIWIYATINGQSYWQMREVSSSSGGGNAGQNSLVAHFGLGDATQIDIVRIDWPSGLSEEAYNIAVNQKLVIGEYNLVATAATVSPQPDGVLENNTAVTLEFTRPVDMANLSSYLTFTSQNYGDFPFFLEIESDSKAVLTPEFTYPYYDVILLSVNDGLLDEAGNAVDLSNVRNLQFLTGLPADYNSDGLVNYEDFGIFRNLWYSSDAAYINSHDLFPRAGMPPNMIVEPDGQFGYDELMNLVYMWNWSHNQIDRLSGKVLVNTGAISEISVQNHVIACAVADGAISGQVVLHYDPLLVAVSTSGRTGDEALILNKVNPEIGLAIVEFLQIGDKSITALNFNHDPLKRQNYIVQLDYSYLDQQGVVIAAGNQLLDIAAVPDKYALLQNYPNPFNPVTTINYDLPEAVNVVLTIYDITGRQVIRLVDEQQVAGYKSVRWNGRNSSGRLVSAGMYFYSIAAGDFSAVKKMVLLK